MRFFVSLAIIFVGTSAFAARKAETNRSTTSKHPINSVLYQVPHHKTEASGLLRILFGNSTIETPVGVNTATDEYQTTKIENIYEADYGVLPNLSLGLNLGYASSNIKNSNYTNSGGVVAPLEPSVKDSGLTDPNILLNYRLMDSSFVVDLIGNLRMAFIGATRGVATDTNADGQGDVASNGNAASGSYAAKVGGRVGWELFTDLNLIGTLNVEYNFDGQVTYKDSIGERVVDNDAYTSFAPRIEAEYFMTKEFALNPFLQVQFDPKKKSQSTQTGVNTNIEKQGAKTISLGINGSYLISNDLALKAGYSYLSIESAKTTSTTGGLPVVQNAKDLDAHVIFAQLMYEF